MADAPIATAESVDETDNAVPAKIETLFAEYDANGDGVVSEEELTSSLEKAFPDMPSWAREHIPLQYKKYASAEPPGLDKPSFTKVYAAFLFRYFDENGDGALQVSECEKALNYLAGGNLAVAVPAHVQNEQVVSKLDFWLMFKAMMGLPPSKPTKPPLEAAADALIAAGFRGSDAEVEWLKARVATATGGAVS